jgi:hypothetical protein
MSNDVHDNHGQTPAAWTAVIIIIFAFFLGTFGVIIAQPWLFWLSVGLIVVGLIVGQVMSMMGYGAKREDDSSTVQS